MAAGPAAAIDTSGCPPARLWSTAIPDHHAISFPPPPAIAGDTAGNLYVVDTGFVSGPGNQLHVVRLSPNGVVQWSRMYDPWPDAYGYGSIVGVDQMNRVLAVGERGGDWTIYRLDASGNVLATGAITGTGGGCRAIVAEPSGSVFIAGAWWNGSGFDGYVAKLGPSLGLVWATTYASGETGAAGAALAANGDLVVAGPMPGPAGGRDWSVRRYTSGGSLVWARSFDGPTAGDDRADGVVIAGSVIHVGGLEDRMSAYGGSGYRTLRALDSNGDVIWTYRGRDAGEGAGVSGALIVTPAGGVLSMPGSTNSPLGSKPGGWLVLGSNGFREWGAKSYGQGAAITNGRVAVNHDGVVDCYRFEPPPPCVYGLKEYLPVVYPNPASGDVVELALNLSTDLPQLIVEVYNLNSQRLYRGTWRDVSRHDGGISISGVSRWPPGVYTIIVNVPGSDSAWTPVRLVVER